MFPQPQIPGERERERESKFLITKQAMNSQLAFLMKIEERKRGEAETIVTSLTSGNIIIS